MSDPLAGLRCSLEAARAAREPVALSLDRVEQRLTEDKALAADKARLEVEHGAAVARAVELGQPSPEPSPELIRLSAAVHAAERRRPHLELRREQFAAELQQHDHRISDLALRYDEQAWEAVPSACHELYAQAEVVMLEADRCLERIGSVRRVAHETAHRQVNGGSPQTTPAWRCYQRLTAMIGVLRQRPNAESDFRTGAEVVNAVMTGTATFSDISRFEPPRRAPANGTDHINRLTQAHTDAPDGHLSDPMPNTSEPEMAPPASANSGWPPWGPP